MARVPPASRWGDQHPQWRGDVASASSKRGRARRLYKLGNCERCGKKATDRHHIDGNAGNNLSSNIAILCRRCHMEIDGRLVQLPIIAKNRPPRTRRTHCRRGHAYAEDSYVDPHGYYACRICRRLIRGKGWKMKVTQVVCDKCGEPEVAASLRLTEGKSSFIADLCAACARSVESLIPGGRTQAKRGRPKKS